MYRLIVVDDEEEVRKGIIEKLNGINMASRLSESRKRH